MKIVKTLHHYLFCLFLCLSLPLNLVASQIHNSHHPHSQLTLHSNYTQLKQGDTLLLKATLHLDPEWHSYWKNPGNIGKSLSINWDKKSPIKHSRIYWPAPSIIESNNSYSLGYTQKMTLIIEVQTKKTRDKTLHLNGSFHWLICKESCIPQQSHIKISLPHGPSIKSPSYTDINTLKKAYDYPRHTVQTNETSLTLNTPLPDSTKLRFFPYKKGAAPQTLPWISSNETSTIPLTKITDLKEGGLLKIQAKGTHSYIEINTVEKKKPRPNILKMLGLAFIGGIILNLMPCVLPILSLKALQLLQQQHNTVQTRLKKASFYTLGILSSLLALLITLELLKISGQNVGWGFQLQSSGFVFFLSVLMAAISLNFIGLLPLPSWLFSLQQQASDTQQKHSSNDFINGCLAVVLATPCSAAFMATAIGFALSQSLSISISIFMALGLGLASPFIGIALIPQSVKFLPKPGPWMVTLQKSLALPLAGSVIWLLWILKQQTPSEHWLAFIMALSLLCLGFCLKHRPLRYSLILLGLGLSLIPIYNTVPVKNDNALQFKQLTQEQQNGQAIFLVVTADWCLTCKTNETLVLNTQQTQSLLKQHAVKVITLDWTQHDPSITAYLKSFGHITVPFYVYYPPNKPAIVLGSTISYKKIKKIIKNHGGTHE
ncbi:MAG: protein-disulfide reductase DsbD domain-containing protein [bacterium]